MKTFFKTIFAKLFRTSPAATISTSSFTVSGNVGKAQASVTWAGAQGFGTVVADEFGNFHVGGLASGVYVITPHKLGSIFHPTDRTILVDGDVSVNFTDPSSVVDCRIIPNASRLVNGTLIYDVQTSSNPNVPSKDSRVSVPVACGSYPQNSRA
jgi:hypothetical protein